MVPQTDISMTLCMCGKNHGNGPCEKFPHFIIILLTHFDVSYIAMYGEIKVKFFVLKSKVVPEIYNNITFCKVRPAFGNS